MKKLILFISIFCGCLKSADICPKRAIQNVILKKAQESVDSFLKRKVLNYNTATLIKEHKYFYEFCCEFKNENGKYKNLVERANSIVDIIESCVEKYLQHIKKKLKDDYVIKISVYYQELDELHDYFQTITDTQNLAKKIEELSKEVKEKESLMKKNAFIYCNRLIEFYDGMIDNGQEFDAQKAIQELIDDAEWLKIEGIMDLVAKSQSVIKKIVDRELSKKINH